MFRKSIFLYQRVPIVPQFFKYLIIVLDVSSVLTLRNMVHIPYIVTNRRSYPKYYQLNCKTRCEYLSISGQWLSCFLPRYFRRTSRTSKKCSWKKMYRYKGNSLITQLSYGSVSLYNLDCQKDKPTGINSELDNRERALTELDNYDIVNVPLWGSLECETGQNN